MPNILFVCTANQYRSPLAAAFFSRKLRADGASPDWLVESAGTWTVPGRGVPSDVTLAARGMGIDLKEHRTRQIDHDLLAKCDLILVMEKGHREALCIEFPFIQKKVYLLSMIADQLEYDIADLANSGLETGDIVTEMSRLIDRAYPNICQLIQAYEAI
jgi:protein-tyrosine phosphatase